MEVSRAIAEVLRHDSDKKIWYTQEVLSVSLKGFRKFQHNDQGVLHTMVTSYTTEQALRRESGLW